MLRLGAVGAESSHLEQFARALDGNVRVVRVLPVDADASAVPPGLDISDDVDRFGDGLDGVLILTRDGRKHEVQARPFLARGLPVFVDKPLACSLLQARAILAAGRVASFSTLRFLPDVETLRASGATIRQIRVPGDGADPNAGFWFHGIHGAELACAVAGRCEIDRAALDGPVLTATVRAPGQSFEMLLDPSAADYEIEHAEGVVTLDTELACTLTARQLERFFSGDDVLSTEQMLAPIALLEAALSEARPAAVPSPPASLARYT